MAIRTATRALIAAATLAAAWYAAAAPPGGGRAPALPDSSGAEDAPALDLREEAAPLGFDVRPVEVEGRFVWQPAGEAGAERLCFEPSAGAGADPGWFCLSDPARARAMLGIDAARPGTACRVEGTARIALAGGVREGEDAPAADLARVVSAVIAPAPAEPPRAVGAADGAHVVFDVPLASAGLPGDGAGARVRAAVRPGVGVWLIDAAAPLVGLDWHGRRIAAPATVAAVAAPRAAAPAALDVPLAVAAGEGVVRAVRLRGAPGGPLRAVVETSGPGAGPGGARAFAPAAPPIHAYLLPDGTVLAHAGLAGPTWWAYPATGAAARLELPPSRGAGAVVGAELLVQALDGALLRVDAAGGVRPVRGCERCGQGVLVGGPGPWFGCLERSAPYERPPASGYRRTLHVCRLLPDGAAGAGARAVEPDQRFGDACHVRRPLLGAAALDAEGRFLELEVATAAGPRLRLVEYAAPRSP